jgi:hypothetical protein
MHQGGLTEVRPRARRWRGAVMVVLTMFALGPLAPAADAVGPEELHPLLLALSVRPWWGDPPALAPAGLDGQRHSLDAVRGRVVLLYFWATW